jgi:prepilin-type processing-associated H-X9-DG protein
MPHIEQDNLFRQADTWARTTTSPEQYRWWPWGGFWLSPPTPANPALGTLVKTWQCPGDSRTLVAVDVDGMKIAFTAYLGVSGTTGSASNGLLYYQSKVRLVDIKDGTSNTLLVGERPPSQDLYYGWWFAGAGYDGRGSGDVVLGSSDTAYASYLGCSTAKVGLQPGVLSNNCDQAHFWSVHSGGANFLKADGSARFMNYNNNSVLPALVTRQGGEVANDL